MGQVPAPLTPRRPGPSSQRHYASSQAAPCLGPGDPGADAHCPESPMPASHPPSSLPPHLCLKLGLAWLSVDSTLAWLSFSPGYGRVNVCVFRWTGQKLCLVGAPITPLQGIQSAPISTPLTLALHLGRGAAASGKAGRWGQGRGSFLKERKPGSLGTEKARVPPPTHGFLSPPPPSANTWHGHKQGLCSLPLG